MKLLPLKNNVLFRFLDETGGAKGRFTDRTTKSGIVLPTLDSAQKTPRWGQVVAAGPDAQVVEGDYILIEALMWSYGVSVGEGDEKEKFWKTDDSKILMVAEDYDETTRTSF